MDNETLPLFDVVCHTTGCGNAGSTVRVPANPVPVVICGVCGQRITDITPV